MHFKIFSYLQYHITNLNGNNRTTTKSGPLILFYFIIYLDAVHLFLLIIQMSSCLWE